MDDTADRETPTSPVSMRSMAREISSGRRELHALRRYVRDLLIVTQCMLATMITAVTLYAAHWWWVAGR